MKINQDTLFTVVLGMVLFTLLDRLFLSDLIDGLLTPKPKV